MSTYQETKSEELPGPGPAEDVLIIRVDDSRNIDDMNLILLGPPSCQAS